MKCPYCGNEEDSKANYCSVCGGPSRSTLAQVASRAEESHRRKGRSRLISAVVYIAIVVLILSIPAYITLTTVVNVTTTDVSLSVETASEVADPFHSPADGNRFVQISATIANNGKTTITLVPFEFHILTSDGGTYDYTRQYDDTVPDVLNAGSKATFAIAFEVPTDRTLTKLSYQTVFTSNFVDAPIGTVSHSEVKMLLTVANVTEMPSSWEAGSNDLRVAFNLTNGYDTPLALTLDMFTLETTGGTILDYTAVKDENLGQLAADSTGSWYIVYVIQTDETPEKLSFDCGGVHIEAVIPG